jgi:hypothetical protein
VGRGHCGVPLPQMPFQASEHTSSLGPSGVNAPIRE